MSESPTTLKLVGRFVMRKCIEVPQGPKLFQMRDTQLWWLGGWQSIPAAGHANVTNPYTDHLLPRIEEEEREEEEQDSSGIEASSVSEFAEEDPQTSSTTAGKEDNDSSDASMEL